MSVWLVVMYVCRFTGYRILKSSLDRGNLTVSQMPFSGI